MAWRELPVIYRLSAFDHAATAEDQLWDPPDNPEIQSVTGSTMPSVPNRIAAPGGRRLMDRYTAVRRWEWKWNDACSPLERSWPG